MAQICYKTSKNRSPSSQVWYKLPHETTPLAEAASDGLSWLR